MRNIHERALPVPAATVGELLDRLGTPDDPLWPAPVWPPLRLDRPLSVGADGGHGSVRYVVSDYQPGRRVQFRFHAETGLEGFHTLEVEPLGATSCLLRHRLVARPRGRMRVLMPLVVRWMHDALLEDLLDNAERAVTATVARPRRHSPWVRLLLWMSAPPARAGALPASATLLSGSLPEVDYSDAYSIVVPAGVSADPQAWAAALVSGLPRRAAPGPQLAENDSEVLLGADEKQLSYRASVIVAAGTDRHVVTLGTVVRLHSVTGRAYFAVVRRVHPLLVRFLLRRAAVRMTSSPSPERGRMIR